MKSCTFEMSCNPQGHHNFENEARLAEMNAVILVVNGICARFVAEYTRKFARSWVKSTHPLSDGEYDEGAYNLMEFAKHLARRADDCVDGHKRYHQWNTSLCNADYVWGVMLDSVIDSIDRETRPHEGSSLGELSDALQATIECACNTARDMSASRCAHK